MPNETLHEDFLQNLISACKLIPKSHFFISRYEANNVYRERVYCYELYFQFRGLQNSSPLLKELCLMGEIDKRQTRFENENPDFVFHNPGTMDQNIVVIEVKQSENSTRSGDFRKLKKFTIEYGYQVGIALWYGPVAPTRNDIDQIPERCLILHHPAPGEIPKIYDRNSMVP